MAKTYSNKSNTDPKKAPTSSGAKLNLLKIHPDDSPEQKKMKEKNNETAATRYKNSLSGPAGIKNVKQYGAPKNQQQGRSMTVLVADPESVQKADSVRSLMVKKYQKPKK